METASQPTPTANQTRNALLAWVIWGLAALFYFYEFFLQVSPSVMLPDLMSSFKVDAEAISLLTSLYFIIYSSMQIPVGILLDRYGPRHLVIGASACCALGSLIFSRASSIHMAEIGRVMIGFGSAFAVISCLKLAANWFPLRRFAMLTGLTVTVGMMGAITGDAPLAFVVENIGWRHSMLLLAIVGAVLCFAAIIIIRDKPKAYHATEHTDNNPAPSLKGLLMVLKSKQSWFASIYGGLMFAPTSVFAAAWGETFLEQLYKVSRPHAAGLVSLIFFGWAIGSPLCGWISDTLGRRLPTMYVGSIMALIVSSIMIYVPHLPIPLMAVLLFCFGMFSSGFLSAFPLVREINPPRYNATALAFINTLNMLGGATVLPVVGWLLVRNWNGTMVKGSPVYSIADYHIALVFIPLSFLLALSFLPFIKETYCKEAHDG